MNHFKIIFHNFNKKDLVLKKEKVWAIEKKFQVNNNYEKFKLNCFIKLGPGSYLVKDAFGGPRWGFGSGNRG